MRVNERRRSGRRGTGEGRGGKGGMRLVYVLQVPLFPVRSLSSPAIAPSPERRRDRDRKGERERERERER